MGLTGWVGGRMRPFRLKTGAKKSWEPENRQKTLRRRKFAGLQLNRTISGNNLRGFVFQRIVLSADQWAIGFLAIAVFVFKNGQPAGGFDLRKALRPSSPRPPKADVPSVLRLDKTREVFAKDCPFHPFHPINRRGTEVGHHRPEAALWRPRSPGTPSSPT